MRRRRRNAKASADSPPRTAAEGSGTALMLTAFVAIQLVLLGRLFRASLRAAGQKASVAGILARLRPTS